MRHNSRSRSRSVNKERPHKYRNTKPYSTEKLRHNSRSHSRSLNEEITHNYRKLRHNAGSRSLSLNKEKHHRNFDSKTYLNKRKKNKSRSRSPSFNKEKRNRNSDSKICSHEKKRSKSRSCSKSSRRGEKIASLGEIRQSERISMSSSICKESVKKKRDSKSSQVNLKEVERAAKLKEMLENAEWREKERSDKVKKYRDSYAKEEEQQNQNRDCDSYFFKEIKKALNNYTSIESRLGANMNNIQRNERVMDSNFARK